MVAAISDIKNYIQVDDRIGTGGQPTAEQFTALRASGYEVVVNLLPGEQDNALKGEDRLVRDLAMDYRYIPVAWASPQLSDFTAFCDAMQQLQDKKVFVHCAMNMRVTAFYSSYAIKYLGWSEDQTDALVARGWQDGKSFKMNDCWRAFLAQTRR